MEAYPLYDYIQINKSSSVSTSADELNGIYTFNIPNGFYQSNQRSSVSTIEASIGRIRTVDDTVTPIHNINCCLVSPTPINANTVGNNAILPPTLFQVEPSQGGNTHLARRIGRNHQQENPAYQISARPSQIKVMMVLDGLGSNQNIVGNLLADFVITLKFVYYDPIKTTLGLGNQYTPTIP
tara:strand:- start:851 stop:1396 length:546 start_codon:yes stop_codon:yes gene_type:complete